MGKQRTANAGVSIFAAEHRVEKKKRKASDMSIFDHVNQAQIMQQSMIQHAAPTLQGVANAAPTASVSDIASAFGLDSRSHDAHGPALGDSPMRRTRVSRTTSFGPDTSFGPRSDSFTPLPMQPSQSMANSGLDMLESLHDLSDPGFGVASSPAIIPGSPMRRTRSRGLAPLPLQTSISELVSSFIDGDSM